MPNIFSNEEVYVHFALLSIDNMLLYDTINNISSTEEVDKNVPVTIMFFISFNSYF